MNNNSTYSTIYSWSNASNNLITISLMHDPENKYQKYFVFLSISPGEKQSNGKRTFNMKNSISFKIGLEVLDEFAFALEAYAKKQQACLGGNFSIFTDSRNSNYGNGSQKSLSMMYSEPSEQSKNMPTVVLFAKTSQMQKALPVTLSIPRALVIAKVCHKIFDKGVDLDMKDFKGYVRQNNYSQTSQQQHQNNMEDAPIGSSPMSPVMSVTSEAAPW